MKTNNDNALMQFTLEADTTLQAGRYNGTMCGDTLVFSVDGTAWQFTTSVSVRGRIDVVVEVDGCSIVVVTEATKWVNPDIDDETAAQRRRGLERELSELSDDATPPAIAAFLAGAAEGATHQQWSILYEEMESVIDANMDMVDALRLMQRGADDIEQRRGIAVQTVESFVKVMLPQVTV